MGDNPKAMSRWEATKVIVPLIGIAIVLTNLIGLWDLPGQDKVREARAKAREEQKYWADSIRRRKEESKGSRRSQKELRSSSTGYAAHFWPIAVATAMAGCVADISWKEWCCQTGLNCYGRTPVH